MLTWFHVEIHHTLFFKSVKMSRSTFTRKCCQNTIWRKKFLFSSKDWITQQTHKHRSARSCYSQLTEKSKKAPNLQAPICEREGHMRSAEFFNKLRLLMTAVSTFWIQFLVKHWDMKIIDCFTFRFLSMALNPMFRASIIRN